MYLVTGGSSNMLLDSTEIMVEEKTGWEILEKHPLPHPMKDLRGISIQNKIFMIGKNVLRLSTQILPYKDFSSILIHFKLSCRKPILLNIS